jgi:hypothetical protein
VPGRVLSTDSGEGAPDRARERRRPDILSFLASDSTTHGTARPWLSHPPGRSRRADRFARPPVKYDPGSRRLIACHVISAAIFTVLPQTASNSLHRGINRSGIGAPSRVRILVSLMFEQTGLVHNRQKEEVRHEMIRHLAENGPVGVAVGVRRLTLATLAIVVSGVAVLPPAGANAMAIHQGSRAIVISDDHGPLIWGEGWHNKNYAAVKSPTIMRGAQQISISISEKTRTQAGFCRKKAWVCKISQRIGY